VSDITNTEVNSFDALTNVRLFLIAHDQPPWCCKKDASKTLTCGRLKGKKKNVVNLLWLLHTWQLGIRSTFTINTTIAHCLLNLLCQSQFYMQLR